jgi:hypothetical protein
MVAVNQPVAENVFDKLLGKYPYCEKPYEFVPG